MSVSLLIKWLLCNIVHIFKIMKIKTGEGESGMNWQSDIERYTLLYVKQIASSNLLYDTKLSLVLCDNIEG